jgi:hypothetical protein
MKTKTPKPTAAKTRKAKADNPEQFRRFVETARKIGVDENPEVFDRAFEKIVPPKSPSSNKAP